MTPFQPNWKLLEELRSRFLSENFSSSSYWNQRENLVQYDHTFAERIGWKWLAVLHELAGRLPAPNRPVTLVDWGCGTGIASRSFIQTFKPESVNELILWDHSPLAIEYSQKRIQALVPDLKIHSDLTQIKDKAFTLCVSHVLNELTSADLKDLLALAKRAEMVIWVEPGTSSVSRQLIAVREQLRSSLEVIAPCPHQAACGLISEKPVRNWCHFFASPPSTIFQSSFWSEFSHRLGIDLRALPTSFLVLGCPQASSWPIPPVGKTLRVLGRARHYRGYSLALTCSQEGVHEKKLLTRDKKETIDIIKETCLTQWIQ